MKKYKQQSFLERLQQKLDAKYGKGIYKACMILLLFGCLSLTSCANEGKQAQTQETASNSRAASPNPRTPSGQRITITNSGQTQTPDEPLEVLTDNTIQQVTDVYFAKKTVTDNGATVNFTPIDSTHEQQDLSGRRVNGQVPVIPYDSILGKTVYLVIETNNLTGLGLDVVIQPSNDTMTGNTNSLPLMGFDPATNTYRPTTLFQTTVSDFSHLQNRDGSHAHYTNLDREHNNKAIIKLQLRPQARETFNEWARNIGQNSVCFQVMVERGDNEPCAYGNSNEEVNGAGTFLNDDSRRFRVVNRNFYEIYHSTNLYNVLPEIRIAKNNIQTNIRQRIVKAINGNSNQVVYFYFDCFDNEHLLCSKDILVVNNKTRMDTVPSLSRRGELINTINYDENRRLGESIDAQRLEIYQNGTLGIDYRSTAVNTARDRWYANQQGTSQLVNMDHLLAPLPTRQTSNYIFEEFNYQRGGVNIRYGFMNTRRRHIRTDIYAGFLGALAQFRQEGHEHYIVSQGFSYEDGSCFPSAEHVNGEAGDLNYLSTYEDGRSITLQSSDFDYDNQVVFCNILIDYGFQVSRSEFFSNQLNTSLEDNNQGTLLPNARHTTNPRHNNHLHVFRFRLTPDIYA